MTIRHHHHQKNKILGPQIGFPVRAKEEDRWYDPIFVGAALKNLLT